jgi:hypothetical protein
MPVDTKRRVAHRGVYFHDARGTLQGRSSEEQVSETKVGPSDFAQEVERLKAAGKFPDLETLLAAIEETRSTYREKILNARRERD